MRYENTKCRYVVLLSQIPIDKSRLLLSLLYYIRHALKPFAELVESPGSDLIETISQLLAQRSRPLSS